MRGSEDTSLLVKILIGIIGFAIIYILVVENAVVSGKTQGTNIAFQQFCYQWGLRDYDTGELSFDVGTIHYNVVEECKKGLHEDDSTELNLLLENCKKVCFGV